MLVPMFEVSWMRLIYFVAYINLARTFIISIIVGSYDLIKINYFYRPILHASMTFITLFLIVHLPSMCCNNPYIYIFSCSVFQTCIHKRMCSIKIIIYNKLFVYLWWFLCITRDVRSDLSRL